MYVYISIQPQATDEIRDWGFSEIGGGGGGGKALGCKKRLIVVSKL